MSATIKSIGLLTLGAFSVAFALPFWLLMGVLGWREPYVPVVCALLGALAALALTRLVAKTARGGRAAVPRPFSQAELLRGREEIAARIQNFANDPRWPRWAQLIRRYSVMSEATVEAWERRYQEILADPKRRHHAPSMLQGDSRTDRQLDYADDPSMLCTCLHLQPLERALRALPVGCAPLNGPNVIASVTVDFDAVKRSFATPECVTFSLFVPHPHASHEDVIACSACRSSITTIGGAPFP